MQTYPSFRNKIVLIQFIPSVYCLSNITPASQSHANDMTDSIASFKALRSDIVAITSEIHKEFGTHCLLLQEGNPPPAKRLAIWSQTQILLIATLKDGLCIPPLEFVTVKKKLNDFHNSSMVISEYAGCSNAFSGFHDFNSFSLFDLCQSLDAALSTPPEKKAEMMSIAYKYTSRRTFKLWVESFLTSLKQMYNPANVQNRYIYLGLRVDSSILARQRVIATQLDIE
jgi:trehalose-6-phosphate synthase